MAQLGRLHTTVTDSTGAAISGASIEVRKQGATIQSGGATSFTVDDPGSITAADECALGTGSTSIGVDSVAVTNVTLAGPGLSGSANNDRLTVTNNLPTLYLDAQGNQSTTNPVTTDSTGQVDVWVEVVPYDVHVSGSGVTTELRQDQVPEGFGQVTDNTFDAATSINYIRDNQRALTTSGSRLVSWRDNGTEVAYIGKGTYGIGLGLGNNAAPDTNGATDQKLYVDEIRTISGAAASQVYIAGEVTQRAHGTASETGILLNAFKVIQRIGNGSTGGGGYTTNVIATGNYLEYRGDDNLASSTLFGAESASTMYTGATISGLTGSFNVAQSDGGACNVTTAIGAQGIARHAGTASGTITSARGVHGDAGLYDTGSGDITTAWGGYFTITKEGGVSGTIATAYGVEIPALTEGTTNNFGLRIGAASGGATTNQSLRVDGGETAILGTMVSTFIDFSADDATPDVSGGTNFRTVNTGVTVTDFDNGVNGQIIRVLFSDSSTTIDFTGTNLKGNAGVDWSPAANDHMTCVFRGGSWYCDISDNTA